jgi:ABC-type antimicrobial peptide transport system permease subunit
LDQNAWEPGYGGPKLDVRFNRVSPGYFRTMGIRFVAGRDFDPHDDLAAPKVAIVNEQFARKIFQGKNPIGRTFRRKATLLLALGLTIGVGFAVWAGRADASVVYGMKPGDPLTLGAAVAVLAFVALAASYASASRASRLQPMDALREE